MDMLNLADKAARCVLGKHPYHWTSEDWQDAAQEAVCGILKADSENEGVAFTAAKHAIYDWLRLWLRHRSAGSLLEYVDFSPSDESSSPSLDLEPLRQMLAQIRTGKVNPEKIEQEIRFLDLRRQGYSMAGVGLELGLTRRNTYAVRERLLPRLEMIARGEQPQRKKTIQEASLENLRRTNADPEALKRRGEAIRLGKVRKRLSDAATYEAVEEQ